MISAARAGMLADIIAEFHLEQRERETETVREAAAALDQVRPGWASRVDTDRLNLRSIHDCVLGQVFEHQREWCKPWTWVAPIACGYGRGERVLRKAGFRERDAVFAYRGYEPLWLEEISKRKTEEARSECDTHIEHSRRHSLWEIAGAWFRNTGGVPQAR